MQLRLSVEPGGRSFLNRKDMEGNDVYKTITVAAEGEYSEKRSKFLAFIHPVHTVDEVKEQVEFYQKKYYDARHCCYAYMLGHERKDFRANDNGGIKLGTSGLIQAYKAAAIEAIQAARIIEKTVDEEITFFFEYPFMNSVMRIVKEEEPSIVRQGYEHDCSMTLRIRKGSMPRLKSRLEKVETLRFEDDGE